MMLTFDLKFEGQSAPGPEVTKFTVLMLRSITVAEEETAERRSKIKGEEMRKRRRKREGAFIS